MLLTDEIDELGLQGSLTHPTITLGEEIIALKVRIRTDQCDLYLSTRKLSLTQSLIVVKVPSTLITDLLLVLEVEIVLIRTGGEQVTEGVLEHRIVPV